MTKNNLGYIHSVETAGLLDGPGIRYVVFLQGCLLRCSYCHNPDTWCTKSNSSYTPEDLINKILSYKPYFKNGGGVTFSGGEPLLQSEFLLECLKLCKKNNIHTAIDTAGIYNTNIEEILDYVDLVILDIKDYREKEYKELTLYPIEKSLEFLKICINKNKRLWLRQVIVPDFNDNDTYVKGLADFIKDIPNVDKIEFLPYEIFGVHKYKELGLKYRLSGVPPMDKDKCNDLFKILKENL